MKKTLSLITVSLSLFFGINSAEAASVTLYNGSLGTAPGSQGELVPGAVKSDGSITFINQTLVTGGVKVDTDANNAEYSGYSNYSPLTESFVNASFPTLDDNVGYSVFFNASLDATTSDDDDRTAFNVLVVGASNKAIQISFEDGLIFAQENGFTRGENTLFDTASNTNYEIRVRNGNYTLFAGSLQILNGALRQYSFDPATSDPPIFNPFTGNYLNFYEIPNFISFGDDTGQEDGVFTFRSASVTTAAAVPFEFSPGLGLLILGAWLAIFQLKNRKKQSRTSEKVRQLVEVSASKKD
ncbi:MAG: hypothetical protein SAJ37_00525 [Oscillatoria sp. PMC 1068.18]|nr:hypothetical protein [Oscillatoria sp. PMC 1076.18]MEC4987206.1 hypothetical protein [Oscillatoria sp. PMC 1068.18]